MRFESESFWIPESRLEKTNQKKRGDKRNPFRKDETQRVVESDEGKERPGKRREHDAQRFQVNLHGGLSLSLSLSGGGCSEEEGRKNVVSETGSKRPGKDSKTLNL
tara:strand:- start:115 stop:432 length:318 start_codon:yes stop_codon:yes gene_type:complete